MSTQSRSETNKEIRRILVRNGVDTTRVQYSCSGRTILLSGGLYKDGGKDIPLANVESIYQQISRMGMSIFCELENWTISEGAISKKGGNSKEKPGHGPNHSGQANETAKKAS